MRRYATVLLDGVSRLAVMEGDSLRPCRETLAELIATGQATPTDERPVIAAAARYDLPVVPGARIICVGTNYEEHRRETSRPASAHPVLFLRLIESLVAHGEDLVTPSDEFDYEGELAILIGRGGRAIPAAQAMSHVWGYTAFMDGSARDWQRHTHQFTAGKNFDRSGSMGPVIIPAGDAGDPAQMQLRTILNGVTLQEGRGDQMIFDIPEIIEYVSRFMALHPGDVIATGTPGGVGMKRVPPVYMKPGDVIEVEITGLCRLENPVV